MIDDERDPADDEGNGSAIGDETRTFEFGPTPDEVGVARRSVVGAVEDLGGVTSQVVLDDLALVASEAIGNAIEHAQTDVRVTVSRLGTTIHVAVHDDDPSPIPEPRPAGEDEPTGRGLFIINALAQCWGVEDIKGDGKILWFELEGDRPAA